MTLTALTSERAVVEVDAPLDLAATLAPLSHGRADRTIRITGDGAWLAMRTPEGTATLRLDHDRDRGEVRAASWGAGAA